MIPLPMIPRLAISHVSPVSLSPRIRRETQEGGTVGTAGIPETTGRLFVSFGCSSPFLHSDSVACYAVSEREDVHTAEAQL
jgi:hypothetical protein